MISHISHTSTIQQEMAKLPVKNIWFCQHDDVAVPSTKYYLEVSFCMKRCDMWLSLKIKINNKILPSCKIILYLVAGNSSQLYSLMYWGLFTPKLCAQLALVNVRFLFPVCIMKPDSSTNVSVKVTALTLEQNSSRVP